MPIHLVAPAQTPGGPDGKGWTRLTVGWQGNNQCALRPTSIATLVEAWDTRRARWGGFDACTNHGRCRTCPLLAGVTTNPLRLPLLPEDDRAQFRVNDRDGRLYLLHQPEKGWDSWGYSWTWLELARLTGWEYDGQFRDEHGEGFWLRRTT